MKRFFVIAATLVTSALATGCLYSDVKTPLNYDAPTPGDVNGNMGKEVTGQSCATAILWLFAFGDAGYDAAVKDARNNANAALLADVKSDTQYTNVLLGIYQKECTVVSGRVATIASASAPSTTPAPAPAPSSSATP
jgi:hypothetical protein